MFDNIGSKCKMLARVICYIGIIISVIAGILLISIGASARENGGTIIAAGILAIIIGSLVSWLSSLGLYGIGEAAENSAIAADLAIKAEMEREQDKKNN